MTVYLRCRNCGTLYTGKCPKCSKRKQKDIDNSKKYNNVRWIKCRENVRKRYANIDLFHLGLYNEIKLIADGDFIVHHIVEANDDMEQFYSLDNLVIVSKANHNEIHRMYRESEQEKQKAITILRLGIQRAKELLGLQD